MEGNAPNPPTNDDIEELIGTTIQNIKEVTKDWPIIEFKRLIKAENKKKPYRNMVRSTLIDHLTKKLNPDCKKNNGKRENKELNYIVESINNKNKTGLKLIESFHKQFGKKIIQMEKAGGRSNRFDLKILFEGDSKWYTVEHKGCRDNKKISIKAKPWEDSVQFLNGNPKSFAICDKYADLWWEKFIKSGELSKEYNIKADIPNLITWKSDAFRQGKEQTEFVKELAIKSTKKNITKSLFKERKQFNDAFVITKKDLQKLHTEIQDQYNISMKNKDYWLKINGDVRKDFEFKWYETPQITPKITNIDVIKGQRDIMSLCSCDNNTSFRAHMRWGYGQGFTNLRLDFK